MTAREVDAEARSVIEEAGFGRFFHHGLGHGLGLEIHEAPRLHKDSEAKLQAGMVVTVEPGIYLPDWGGIRIEDDVLVTPDGCEVLTARPQVARLGPDRLSRGGDAADLTCQGRSPCRESARRVTTTRR